MASDSGMEIMTMLAARNPSGNSVMRDQRDRDREVRRQPVQARCDVLGLIEAAFELDAFRQLRLEAVRGRDHALAHVENVVAVLLVRSDEHSALAVVAADVVVLLRVPADFRDVADAHRAALHRCDDGVAHLIERLVAARRFAG